MSKSTRTRINRERAIFSVLLNAPIGDFNQDAAEFIISAGVNTAADVLLSIK